MDPNLNPNVPPAPPEQFPPTQVPNEIENTKKVSKKLVLIISFFLAILIPLGIYIYVQHKNAVNYPTIPTPTPVATPAQATTFENREGGYSFQTPSGWLAFVNQAASQSSLFGPNANNASGIGGVEVTQSDSLESYLEMAVAANFSAPTDATVSGITGVKRTYVGTSNGTSVSVFKDGFVYNIYIGSTNPSDLEKFDSLVSSFKFLDTSPSPIPSATDSGNQTVCTQEAKLCPDGVTYVGRSGSNCEFAACPTQ